MSTATATISSLAHAAPYGVSTFGFPSYWDVTLTGNPFFGMTYDAWCLNPTKFLSPGNAGTVTLHAVYEPATNYTTLNTGLPASLFSGSTLTASDAINQLDNVNWLLNQHYTANPQYSVSEVQLALWRLLGYTTGSQYLYSSDWQEVDVQALVNAANATGNGFVPGADDVFAVIAEPTFNYPNTQSQAQPIIIETKFAKLGDFVWHDLDADGIQDANEPGIGGAAVTMTGTDAFGAAVNRSTITDGNGLYLFDRLLPGSYTVTFTTPSGFDAVSPSKVGANAAIDSDGLISDVTLLKSGDDNRTVDSGFYQFAGLGDKVWLDQDKDGTQDAGEPGVAGIAVELYACVNGQASGPALASTTTDVNGNYAFTNLKPGDYIVRFVKGGYVLTTQNVGNDALDSDADGGTGFTGCYTLVSGETNNTVDAGVLPAAIGDKVFEDKNANGQQEAGEGGIPGAVVKLYTCVNNAPGQFVAQTTTDANGNYSFAGLLPGDYIVEFITPTGYTQTLANVGADGSDSDAGTGGLTGCYTLASGETNNTVDAGFYQKASLGDYVWADNNGDGQQNDGNTGVNGVKVDLYNSANVLVASTVTANDGNGNPGYYLFENLVPGDYYVKFTAPAGYFFTPQDLGGNDGLDSDANPITGVTVTTTLVPGENDLSWDAGLVQPQWVPDDIIGIDIEKFVRGRYVVEDGGGEGLTPGFWKTHSSYGPAPLSGWPESGYNPDDSYETVFGVSVPGTPSLLDALSTGGGGLDALLRHSTAALLNAANPYVDYAYTVTQVISMTQAAISSGNYETTKDLFAAQNELGADLNTPAGGGTLVETPDFDADDPTGPYIPVGGQAIFTYVVKNTGMVALNNIQVTDDRIANLIFVGGDTDLDGLLDTTETWTYTASETVGAGVQYVNTGTATGTYVPGFTVTDSDKAHYTTASLTSSLGDRVWLDANANGVQDLGEPGVANVTVKLLNGSGTQLASQTTDVNGNYLFTNLAPGDYSVQFVAPTGYAFTAKDQGTNDAKDSDADPVTGKTITTSLVAGEQDLSWDAGLHVLIPGIDIEKTTNGPTNSNPVAPDYDNEDSANGAGVPLLAPGSAVTWTYKVTNTGNTNFAKPDISIVDDNGTPGNDADDLSIANGKIIYQSGDDGDGVLEAGESWLYQASGTVQSLGGLGAAANIDFSGSSATDGSDGNSRSYTAGGVILNVNAWSRDKGTDTWQKAWLGAYGGGLGVTDSSEGSGGNNSHTVDNSGRDNYIVFQFSQDVVVDKAFLGYVVGDSDMTVYVGSTSTPITNMSNAVLNSMSLKEFNDTTSTTTRWADFNAGNVQGNVLILAARDDGHSMDYFKVEQLVFQAVQSGGVYENKATVTATGVTDSDLSHYKNPAVPTKASIGDRVWCDTDGDGIQESGEPGVAGVTVKLLDSAGNVNATTTTDTNGKYMFTGVTPGDYQVQFIKPAGYQSFTKANQGSNDAVDSDADVSTGKTALTTLVAGQNDISWDAGFAPNKATLTYDFNGSSSTDGADGNTRSYTVGGVTVTASAFSRTTGGSWAKAYLGAYNGGHGVTDSSEGNGGNNKHTVDNVDRINYVVYQFSQNVTVDKTYLGYVSGDSDLTAWIGFSSTPITNLSDVLLAGMTKENNDTTSSSTRWADLNAGSKEGNVLVIAASTSDTSPDDYFKIQKLVVCTNDPLVTPIAIDLGGDGIQTVALAEAPQGFDLFGNGQVIRSGWLSGEDGFLAVDRNGNGRIDDISELFGGSAKGEGFSKLASYDSNGDGAVDANDVDFASLKIWQDVNGNHWTDAGELMSLAEAGVASLKVGYAEQPFMDANGNLHLERGSAILSNGGMVDMTDVYFDVSAADATAAGMQLPSLDALLAGMGGGVPATTGDAQPVTVMEPVGEVALIGQQAPAEYWIM